ncbi:MAG: Ypar14, super integron cassette, partial [Gammaproteobacteria bacterium]|nr:Ypar14, super integron cassette [Gammaproteobacteria bacterium]
MPQLVWEPLDFLSALGVAPEVAEYETSHKYVVSQPPIRLEITLWQYDGDVQLHLYVAPFEHPVVRYSMLGCPGARVV